MNQSPGSAGRWAGGGAMAALAFTSFLARLTLGVPTLPDLFADPLLYVMPPTLFSAALDTLRLAAKPILLACVLLGQLAVGALIGWFYAGSLAPKPPRLTFSSAIRPALLLAALGWLFTVLLIFPAVGAGSLGVLLSVGVAPTLASYLLAALVFGLTLAWLYARLGRLELTEPNAGPLDRRSLLRLLGVAITTVIGANIVLEVSEVVRGTSALRAPARLPSPITPIEGFYVVAKDLFPVSVDPAHWGLNVVGDNGRSLHLDLDQLRARPAVELVTTLTCISNPIGGDLLGTARWTGVRLADLLHEVGVGSGARDVVLSAADNYADSIPLELALADDTLLVYLMDGQTLPAVHGFPLRAIVPGRYGIKNVKWLTRVEVIDHGFVGYWPSRGWTDQGIIQTESQIDVPADRSTLPFGAVEVGGIAFAGVRGIQKVELSVDGGQSWLPTTLAPPTSPLTWTTWRIRWRPTGPGWYTLQVRATDGTGQVQPAVVTPPIPNGATGYHQIQVRIG